jgi:hypothetical protein
LGEYVFKIIAISPAVRITIDLVQEPSLKGSGKRVALVFCLRRWWTRLAR